MKLIKVKIRRGDHKIDEPMMVYPNKYDPVEVDRVGMYATAINNALISLSGEIGRGGDHEFCIIAMPDDVADEYATDPDMEIIDSDTANDLMEQWRIGNDFPEETIDPNRIMAIRAKTRS